MGQIYFGVDEAKWVKIQPALTAGYADILKQVRDRTFEEQLHERLELAERDKQSAVDLAKAQLTTELQKAASAKDSEILALQGKLAAANQAQQLAVAQALSSAEKERDALANQLEQTRRDHEAAVALAQAERMAELQKAAASPTRAGCIWPW